MTSLSDPELTRAASLLAGAALVSAACLIGLAALHRESLRRALLRAIDPRPLALFRIAFGLCLALGALEIAPLNLYLYSDEGLLPSAAVPSAIGRAALAGYGDGVREPVGFQDGWGLAYYVASGRWSLLHFWDGPAFVRAYFGAFLVACLGLVVGYRTRACAWLAWLLYAGMLRRGDAHWGGEQVFVSFLFLLALSRCGEAFSLDNRRRVRALRRRGLLSESAGPGGGAGVPPSPAHPQGLAAIYRRVPAWPQALMSVQLAICYAANGWAKAGPSWREGEALLYTLHLDKWTRLDWHALTLSLGPWPFRLATWGVLWWERLFPLLLVGLWLRASARSGAPALRGARRTAARVCWLGLAAALASAAALPSALVEKSGDPAQVERAWSLGLAALVVAAAALAGGSARAAALRAWLVRVPLSPWLWLAFGAAFHVFNLALLNVGMFALATLSAYVLCGVGPAAVRGVQRLARALGRVGFPVPEHMLQETPVPAEDPSLPHLHRDDAALPGWAIAGAGGLVLAGGTAALVLAPAHPVWWWHAAWLSAGTCLVALGWRAARRAGGRPAALAEPWAYGPAGRPAAGGLVAYHLVALVAWQLPKWPAVPWRDPARALVDPWMELSFTRQTWVMFAPNPPRVNRSMRTVIVDAAGVEHDLRTEDQHPENLVRPHLKHNRWRKIGEVLIAHRAALAPWHARHLCRRWALEHGGEVPKGVALQRVVAPIPPPEPVDPTAYFWEHAKVETVVEVLCRDEPFAQLDDEVRARHGLPPAEPGALRYTWPKGQADSWSERRAALDPLVPLWPLLALVLAGALHLWSREDRRRHVAAARSRRG